MQPNDVQRIVAHIPFPRATWRHTFVFRPTFASTLPHCSILAAHLQFFPQLSTHCFFTHYVQGDERTLLQDIAEKKVKRMPGSMKELKVSLPGIVACSFWNMKKKSSPCGTKCPPRSTSLTSFGGSQQQPFEKTLSRSALGRVLTLIFFKLQGFVQRTSWILRCSSQSANLVLFLPLILSSRLGS